MIPQKEEVTLKIYDVSGHLCKTFVDKKLNAGTYNYNWDTKGENRVKLSIDKIPAGVYFILMKGDGFTEKKKIILIK